jgi:hypothetical protein
MNSDAGFMKEGVIYGYLVTNLSYKQIRSAMKFKTTVEPWLNENIGEFDKDWFVEIDKSYDDLRLQFPDPDTETWFNLAWMQRSREDDV